MDSAYWYGLNRSQAGRHSRQIAAWEDYAEELQSDLEEWADAYKSKEAALDSLEKKYNFLNDVAIPAWRKVHAKAVAERDAIAKDANEKVRQLRTKYAVEDAQRVLFQALFANAVNSVPGLKEHVLGASGNGIKDPAISAYVAALRAHSITPEILNDLKAAGYQFFMPPASSFSNPAASEQAAQNPSDKPKETFVPKETVKLREKVDDLRTKYNDLVERHNALLDNRFHWAYQSGLNKAEAEGHKAVLELVRSSSREIDLDTPDPDIPAPEGLCDSPISAAFRRAYARHLLTEEAGREELEQFSTETSFEFPFPVLAYMDWIAGQSQEDVPSEGQEGPQGPR